MAIYFDRVLNYGGTPSPLHISCEWHHAHSVLALASFSNGSGGSIGMFTDEGILMTKVAIPGEGVDTRITGIAWHPQHKVLAVAGQGGNLFTWNDSSQEFLSASSHHTCDVSVLQWSPCGTRLITSDQNGALVGWRIDSKGQLEVAFHHELKDQLTHVVFRGSLKDDYSLDIGGLARAAVGGDEEALDLLSSFRTPAASPKQGNDNPSFYVGAASGIVYFVSDDGSCVEVVPSSFPVRRLLYHQTSDILVVVNESPAIIQYQRKSDGLLEEISRVKLAGQVIETDAVWAGGSTLALTIGELVVRLLDVNSGDNFVLSMIGSNLHSGVEHITCVAYNATEGILAAGTDLGNIQIWKYDASMQDVEAQWAVHGRTSVKGAIKQLEWNLCKDLLAVNTSVNIFLLFSRPMVACLNERVALVQLSASNLALELYSTNRYIPVKLEVQVRGATVTAQNVAVWSGQKVIIYEINPDAARIQQVGNFACETDSVALHEQSAYIIEGGKIQVRTFQGTVKQSLTFLEAEGSVISIDVCGTFLVAATSQGILKLWEISRREAKPFTNPKSVKDEIDHFTRILSVKVNCKGTKVSILLEKDIRVVVWDVEVDGFVELDLSKYLKPEVRGDPEMTGHLVSHFWDPDEPRVLACELYINPPSSLDFLTDRRRSMVFSVFVTSERGAVVQDSVMLDKNLYSRLVGVRVPRYCLLKQVSTEADSSDTMTPHLVGEITLRDFVGLGDDDAVTREAVISFSFNLTVGNMDEAFKAIKKIKSGKVWENMARMCVKTKRLDVAAVCLGHMGHARGAKALRVTVTKENSDAQIAMLAIQLGMLEEAESLYKSSYRFDLLNRFYQASGRWKEAIEVAESKDRIHLRTTYYNFAKYMESKGDFVAAIPNFEMSQTHKFEVPRMLFEELPVLERYITSNGDKNLLKWWAQYMESTGEMETALQFYEKSKDYHSLVRVYCYCNNLEKAAEIANETGDRAACYHMGRQYENNGDIKEAVHFFTRAQAYTNAIRICKEQGMEDQLLNLALMGSKTDMIEAARYYEIRTDRTDRAVMLYHKGGLVGKAIELAFKSDHRSALEQLVHELDERTDPRVLHRCAQYFMESGQPDRAVDLLAKAREYDEAISLCAEHNILLTEEMAEKLTPPKDSMDSASRSRLLEKMAECCYQQENYHLATKKFTQAGNKVKAMKALLKSGDTERIIFFANVSRQQEIYIMAANYLQTLDWHQQPDIMKNIVAFYMKGKAPDLLAGFYSACARIEIDEFQNYEKALGALNEAHHCMSDAAAKNNALRDKLERLTLELDFVKKFVQARRVYEQDTAEAMRLCQMLLKEEFSNAGLRPGDIYAFMIEHYSRENSYKMAYNLIEELRSKSPNVNLTYYIDPTTLVTIHQNLDIPYSNSKAIFNDHTIQRHPQKNNWALDGESDNEVELGTIEERV